MVEKNRSEKMEKKISFTKLSYIHQNFYYSPALDTSQGSLIVSPATNLNVSERDIKLGSGLLICVVTEKKG